MPPLEAALVGAREVGFTLLSMNLSLVAVFVSILFMGGIVERLFREFSITLVGGDRDLAGGVADADADAVRALARSPRRTTEPGRLQRGQRPRVRLAAARLRRARSAGRCAHAPLVHAACCSASMALNVRLYIAAPKSFLPQQDTGQLGGFIRGDDGMSFQVMQPKIEVVPQGRAAPTRRWRAWPASSAAAAASTTRRCSCA